MYISQVLSYFRGCTLLLKLLWISLCVVVLLSLINTFSQAHDTNGWIALLAMYSIHQAAPSILFVFIIAAAFTSILDIARAIVFGHTYDTNYGNPYWATMTIIGIVAKIASAILAFLARDDVEHSQPSGPATYQSPYDQGTGSSSSYAPSETPYMAGTGSTTYNSV